MQTTKIISRLGLATLLLASVSGCCARWNEIPDDCVDALYECDFACMAHDLCSDCGDLSCAEPIHCDEVIEEECVVIAETCEPACKPECSVVPLAKRALAHRKRVAVGPPPVPYRPPMPPKFLAVPTRPVYTEVSPNAPNPDYGQVEVEFGSQLAFPGRD